MQQKQRKELGEKVREFTREGRYSELLSLLDPVTAEAHLQLCDGDREAAGRALCQMWPSRRPRPLIEEYVFGNATNILRALKVGRLVQNPAFREKLARAQFVIE